MPLSTGTRIGPYEVIGELGAGGMGEVYRATDSRLGREVALKILPEVVAGDPERAARFEREARTLASLNHPNIAHLYGLEGQEGRDAIGARAVIVMELVDGPTLADRIAQGAIPLDEALAVARQIADALEAAHELGIVHRDLKPANIKLRPDGTVKVLDFGLAKAIEQAGRSGGSGRSGGPVHDLSHSPTITGPIGVTGVGVLLGTASYMPPEQARGKPVDKRADIWAFGCVLFEMLTGKRCFDGDDTSLVLAEVIKSEPDWKALPAGTPAAVRSTLKQCLQKDPKHRLRDIGDARLALDGAFESDRAVLHDRPTRWKRPAVLVPAGVAAGILIGALGAAALRLARVEPPPAARPVTRYAVPLPAGASFRDNLTTPMLLTDDGRRLVMNVSVGGSDRVLVRALDQIQPQAVQGLEGLVGSLFLSPDGEWIGFNDGKGLLRRIRISGGTPATIAETGVSGGGWQGATWGRAGTIVFSTASHGTLMEVPAAGGTSKPRTTAAEGETHSQPHFLPDGRALLFVVRSPGQPQRIAYLPGDATSHSILLEGTDPRCLPSGHLLFTRDETVWAVGFDAGTGRIAGDPAPVLEGIRVLGGAGIARMSVSADGTLAYEPGVGAGRRTIVRVDRQGREEPLPGLRADRYEAIRISPDGTKLAYTTGRPADVWTYDLARGSASRVTTGDDHEVMPVWSPDGTRLLFTSVLNGQSVLYVRNADGTGQAERFLQPVAATGLAESWFRDGKTVVVTQLRGVTPDVVAIDLASEPRVRPLVATPAADAAAALSPDGRWLAYQSNVSGGFEIYVERFPELGDRQRISTSGGTSPRWSADGRELFFQSGDGRRIISVPMAAGQKLTAGAPSPLFEGSYVPTGPSIRPFDVMPSGGFLLLKQAAVDSNEAPTLIVVQNWVEELKRLVPPPGTGR